MKSSWEHLERDTLAVVLSVEPGAQQRAMGFPGPSEDVGPRAGSCYAAHCRAMRITVALPNMTDGER